VKTVIVADNHPLFRIGVRQLVDESNLFSVIAEAGDGKTCLFQVESMKPDWLVLDLNMPEMGGFDVARTLRERQSVCRIAILTMHSSDEFVSHSRAIGCNAFIAKEDAGQELVAILSCDTDAFQMSSSAGKGEGAVAVVPEIADPAPPGLEGLSKAELRILREIAQARTSESIADMLHISVRTVHTHRQNMCRKLNLSGVNSLLTFALENRETIIEHGERGR